MTSTVHAVMRVMIEVPVRASSPDETLAQLLEAAQREAEGVLRNKLPREFRVCSQVEFAYATIRELGKS